METRWLALGNSLLMESVAGSSYALSVYGPQLKGLLNLTQADLGTIGSFGNLGSYSVLEAGFLFDAFGPVVTGLAGSVLSLLGYLAMWAATTQRLPGTAAMLSAAAFTWSHGSSFLDVCAVSASVRNFPHDRGRVLGLTKSLYGISASLLVLCYTSLYKPDVTTFLAFLAVLISVVAAVTSLGVRLAPAAETTALTRPEKLKLWVAMAGVFLLAAYITTLGLLQSARTIGDSPAFAYALPAIVLLQLVVVLPSALAAAVFRVPADANVKAAIEPPAPPRRTGVAAPLLGSAAQEEDDAASAAVGTAQGTAVAAPRASAHREGATFLQGLRSVDLWLIWVFLFTGTGAGLVIINNLGSLVQSLGAAADAQDVYITILSVANCAGRQMFGFASDALAHRATRPTWVAVCVFGIAGTCGLLAIADLRLLYLAAATAGFFYGGFWSMTPPLVAERFGSRSFAALNALCNLATALGSFALNAQLAARVYQAHIPAGGGTTCLGAQCFQTTFGVLAALCVLGGCSTLFLAYRLRGLYDERGRVVPYDVYAKALANASAVEAPSAE